LARIRLSPGLGGNPNVFTYVTIANNTGSSLQTLFERDLEDLQYDPQTYMSNLAIMNVATPGGSILRQPIIIEVQLVCRDGSPLSHWIEEVGIITPVQPGTIQYRLSGASMRKFLYFATASGNMELYVAEKKNGVISQLPII
jgi:hypothetical protein